MNDRHLGEDAFNLNKQESCKGHKVYVCYIERDGSLQCSDCVRSIIDDAPTETSQITHDTTIQFTRVERSTRTSDSKDSGWKFDWKSGLLVATGTLPFYGIYRFIKALC